MTMAFGDEVRIIDAFGERSGRQFAFISPEPHGPAHRLDSEQVAQLEDYGVRGVRIEFGRIGVLDAADVAHVLDRRALQPQADAEERLLFAARVCDGADHSRNPALAEAARNQYRIDVAQEVFPAVAGHEVLALDPAEVDAQVVGEAAVYQRLVEALVRIFELDVFADDSDGHRFARAAHPIDERVPLPQVGIAERQSEYVDDQLVEALVVEDQRDLVDPFDVGRVDDGLLRDVAEERNLGLHLGGQLAVAAAEQYVRLNPDGQQFLDRMLRRLGLQLARGGDEGHQRQVYESGVVAPDLVAHLADGFEEGK